MTGWPPLGLARMVRFNWPEYGLAAAAVAAAVVARQMAVLPAGVVALAELGAVVAAWWALASLAAGWWIYDLSPLYCWSWIVAGSPPPGSWVNVTVGFDESSDELERLLGPGVPLDVFDAARMSEPSIRRARASRSPVAGTISASVGRLPFGDAALDAAFVIFSAHEIRSPEDRAALFAELARILRPGGSVTLVEHPRNLANVLAFGPGALHFYPEPVWRRTAAAAGLRLRRRATMTPFVAALTFERS